jgi:signal transduction histidine kinase
LFFSAAGNVMNKSTNSHLHFDVSSGLKSVLGSELITDDEVAILELVKNSFDAAATQVHLYFDNEQIVVADNGNGMTYDEIQHNWLFVAHSEKREQARQSSFRDSISERKYYAGSKGIGRFSSDRLGSVVRLQTKSIKEKTGPVHLVIVDWGKFDVDLKKNFDKIQVDYSVQESGFQLPAGFPRLRHGTVITIQETRAKWERNKVLQLKSALSKLINPFGASTDQFRIFMHAPDEGADDAEEEQRYSGMAEEPPANAIVNGEVRNFIFPTLQEKTTYIDVHLTDGGSSIESALTDRGELIYKIREPNPYALLKNSGFRCQVYFLNQSAKVTFARRMGVPSVRFGSVFLFRNNIRVFPIGEADNDWFGMDRRKQQGYRRFLGTRDVIGRVDVSGVRGDFEEPSSRNTGLIETPAVAQLRDCFFEKGLKRLERYVVPVTFADKEDKNSSDISRLLTDPGRARVLMALAKLVDDDAVELVQYSDRMIRVLNEQSEHFEESLASLHLIAEKANSPELSKTIEAAEKRFQELQQSAEVARRQADEERSAKEAAQLRAEQAERVANQVSERLEEEKKRNLFLTSISTLDTETILNLHHQVTIYSVDIQQQIENFLVHISKEQTVLARDVLDSLEKIALLNRKISGISKFATKANFRLESEQIEADLGQYFEQYIDEIARTFLLGSIAIELSSDKKPLVFKFKPIDVSIVIDNLISNSKKANASRITFEITHPNKDAVYVRVIDNGSGFDQRIGNLDVIFEKGFTTTSGSGLGLFHVRHVLGELNGTINAQRDDKGEGAIFLIRISR